MKYLFAIAHCDSADAVVVSTVAAVGSIDGRVLKQFAAALDRSPTVDCHLGLGDALVPMLRHVQLQPQSVRCCSRLTVRDVLVQSADLQPTHAVASKMQPAIIGKQCVSALFFSFVRVCNCKTTFLPGIEVLCGCFDSQRKAGSDTKMCYYLRFLSSDKR